MDGSVGEQPEDGRCYECVDEEEESPSLKRNFSVFSDEVLARFDSLCDLVKSARERRLEALAFKGIVEEGVGSLDAGHATVDMDGSGEINLDDDSQLGRMLPGDMFAGDANMRTLDIFLRRVDARGYERSAQQLEFHEAFKKAAARVIYRKDWESSKPIIMRKYGWTKVNSEVLISTPRRFGKTYSIAIYCACLAMALGVEIVVFSPARRASRKLLERIVEFIGIAGGQAKICEYNQEACRLNAADGKKSLIRSFPSKVGVSHSALPLELTA